MYVHNGGLKSLKWINIKVINEDSHSDTIQAPYWQIVMNLCRYCNNAETPSVRTSNEKEHMYVCCKMSCMGVFIHARSDRYFIIAKFTFFDEISWDLNIFLITNGANRNRSKIDRQNRYLWNRKRIYKHIYYGQIFCTYIYMQGTTDYRVVLRSGYNFNHVHDVCFQPKSSNVSFVGAYCIRTR